MVLLWARCHKRDLEAASHMLDIYYRAAQDLIDDQSVPNSVVDFVERVSRDAGHPRTARRVAWHILKGQFRPSTDEKRSLQSRQLEADLDALNPRQRDLFAKFFVNSLGASAASDPVLSRIYLTVLWVFFSTSGRRDDTSISVDRAQTAALDMSTEYRDCVAA
jgi:hypothetical protein